MTEPRQRKGSVIPISSDEEQNERCKSQGIDNPQGVDAMPDFTGIKLNVFSDDLLPVLPVPYDALPANIQPWAKDVANRLGCSADFLIAGVLTSLSSLLSGKVIIAPKQKDSWKVTPNLWGGMVGRPSTKKSPSEKESFRFIEELDRKRRASYREDLKSYKAEIELAKILQDDVKREAKKLCKKAGKSADEGRDAAIKHIKDNDPDNITLPPIKRAVVHNTTVEKLIMLLADNDGGLIELRDELSGWLSKLDRDEFAEAREFYLMAFNGDSSYSHDRVSRDSVYIKHCTISVFGGIQPARLKPYLMAAKNGASDDGLLQRFQMLVYPDPVIEVGADEYPSAECQAQLDTIFNYFVSIPEATDDAPAPLIRFTPEAQVYFDEWQVENIAKARKEIFPAMESHLSKYPAFLASLSLIIHLAETQQVTSVGPNSVLKAIGLVEYFESHARRIYGLVDIPDYSARSLAEHLHKLKSPFKPSDFKNKDWSGLTTSADRKQALSTLLSRGYLLEQRTTVKNNARKFSIYHINPKLLED